MEFYSAVTILLPLNDFCASLQGREEQSQENRRDTKDKGQAGGEVADDIAAADKEETQRRKEHISAVLAEAAKRNAHIGLAALDDEKVRSFMSVHWLDAMVEPVVNNKLDGTSNIDDVGLVHTLYCCWRCYKYLLSLYVQSCVWFFFCLLLSPIL